MPQKRFSTLPTDNLNDSEAWPFSDDADEIVIRVSSWAADGKTPASFQAIVRGRDRTKAWGLGILSNPVAALQRAIDDFYSPTTHRRTNADIAGIENDARLGKSVNEEPGLEPEEPSTEDLLG